MALYLGSSGMLKIATDKGVCRLIILSSSPVVNGVLLKSSDGYVLKDSNGVYLTAKKEE